MQISQKNCTNFVILFNLKFFERGLGKTFFQKSFPREFYRTHVKVKNYVENSGNHVLYRATPVYVGTNAVASGIQLEGYSVEDRGKGISFNVYLYNVQPGVNINYSNGDSEMSDNTLNTDGIIPFAVLNASENNPDLMFMICKQLELLFVDQKKTTGYKGIMDSLTEITDEIRNN